MSENALYYSERLALEDATERGDQNVVEIVARLGRTRARVELYEVMLNAIFEATSRPGDATLFNVVKYSKVAFLEAQAVEE
jgi:hypothetical protein